MLKFIKIGKKVLKIVGFLVLLTVLVIVMRKLLMNAASDFEVAVYKMSNQIPNLKSISITDAEGEMIDEITLRVGEKKELSISFSLERESIEGVESLSAEEIIERETIALKEITQEKMDIAISDEQVIEMQNLTIHALSEGTSKVVVSAEGKQDSLIVRVIQEKS